MGDKMEKAKELLNNAEWLKSKYIDERLSRKTISNMLGVSESATRHYIEKFGLCKKAFNSIENMKDIILCGNQVKI